MYYVGYAHHISIFTYTFLKFPIFSVPTDLEKKIKIYRLIFYASAVLCLIAIGLLFYTVPQVYHFLHESRKDVVQQAKGCGVSKIHFGFVLIRHSEIYMLTPIPLQRFHKLLDLIIIFSNKWEREANRNWKWLLCYVKETAEYLWEELHELGAEELVSDNDSTSKGFCSAFSSRRRRALSILKWDMGNQSETCSKPN